MRSRTVIKEVDRLSPRKATKSHLQWYGFSVSLIFVSVNVARIRFIQSTLSGIDIAARKYHHGVAIICFLWGFGLATIEHGPIHAQPQGPPSFVRGLPCRRAYQNLGFVD